jgi:hypothetical protein
MTTNKRKMPWIYGALVEKHKFYPFHDDKGLEREFYLYLIFELNLP